MDAFAECTGLTSIIIPNSVTKIYDDAFSGCTGLTSINIPNSVTSIGCAAFARCTKLTTISLPNGLLTLENSTFSNCVSLTSIKLPVSIKKIGNETPSNMPGPFYGCTNLASIDIPQSVEEIHHSAFEGCTKLTSVVIPDNVSMIYEKCFYGCTGLTTISIGKGMKNLGREMGGCFNKCPNLSDVYCYAESVPYANRNTFIDSYIEYATLHVPASAVNAYKAADPWKNFKSIVAIDGETPTTQKCEKPTISYENGKLKMSCATEGVEYVTDITNADIKKHYDATISLTATYNISVYATKSGYDNSDVTTATLCWIDQTPKTEGITNGVANIPANAVLIQSAGGTITVQGCDEGEQVSIYGINGIQAGQSISQNGAAIVNTNLQPGSIAIVKIGQKSVKVAIK